MEDEKKPMKSINWHFLRQEAKLRRVNQRFTQKRLAMIADVSVPTISRFENGKQDIQLKSVIKILSCLGLVVTEDHAVTQDHEDFCMLKDGPKIRKRVSRKRKEETKDVLS